MNTASIPIVVVVAADLCRSLVQGWELLAWLAWLRGQLRTSQSAALVTFPAALYSESISRRAQHLADAVLSLKALQGDVLLNFLRWSKPLSNAGGVCLCLTGMACPKAGSYIFRQCISILLLVRCSLGMLRGMEPRKEGICILVSFLNAEEDEAMAALIAGYGDALGLLRVHKLPALHTVVRF